MATLPSRAIAPRAGCSSRSGVVVGLLRRAHRFHRGLADSSLGVLFLQMPAQAALLGELAVAEDAMKLGLHMAFVFVMARQAPLGFVSPGAKFTLPLAVGVADLAADGLAMAIQGVSMGQALAAIGAHVHLAGLRSPDVRVLRYRRYRCYTHRRGRQRWREAGVIGDGEINRDRGRHRRLQVELREFRLLI